MLKSGSCVLLTTIFSLGFASTTLADTAEGPLRAREGVVRCGGNNFLRLSGTEIQFAFYQLRNFDTTNSITIDRMRFFDATGAVLADSAVSGLPPSQNGILGPANNTLHPNQTALFDSSTFLANLPQTNRPIQLEIEWSSAGSALTLGVTVAHVSRERDPATGAMGVQRSRSESECRSIFLRFR